MKKHAAPIIAAILLLLPVLYVGSYLALVQPNEGPPIMKAVDPRLPRLTVLIGYSNYRYIGEAGAVAFWPLEKVDRIARPEKWKVRLGCR